MIWNVIPWVISFIMLVISVLTYLHNQHKDNKSEIIDDETQRSNINEQFIKVNMKLDNLCATTSETRIDIKSMDKSLSDFDKRLTVTEEKIKEIYHRLENLEEVRK